MLRVETVPHTAERPATSPKRCPSSTQDADAGRLLVIGIAANEKKYRTFFNRFAEHCHGRGPGQHTARAPCRVRCEPLRFAADGSPAGPWPAVDVVLHKLSDDVAIVEDTDGFFTKAQVAASRTKLAAVEAHVVACGAAIVTSLAALQATSSRMSTAAAVRKAGLVAPSLAVVRDEPEQLRWLHDAVRRGPAQTFVVKTNVACGTRDAHSMRTVTVGSAECVESLSGLDTAGLERAADGEQTVGPGGATGLVRYPHVLQSFVDSSAVYKMYLLGDETAVRVLHNGIPRSASFLSQHGGFFTEQVPTMHIPAPDGRAVPVAVQRALLAVADRVRTQLGLTLVGVDVLIDERAPGAALTSSPGSEADVARLLTALRVIDLNFFPSFTGFDDLHDRIIELALQAADATGKGPAPLA